MYNFVAHWSSLFCVTMLLLLCLPNIITIGMIPSNKCNFNVSIIQYKFINVRIFGLIFKLR